MTPERWERLKELFEAAVMLPTAARARFAAGACGPDEELRSELERLLAEHEAEGDKDAVV